jgi:hypothetical protein
MKRRAEDLQRAGGHMATVVEVAEVVEGKIAPNFFGMVFETISGPVVFTAPASVFRNNWLSRCGTPQTIVFMCAGPDESIVEKVVGQVSLVSADLQSAQPPAAAPGQLGKGSTYVYFYRDPAVPPAFPGDWRDLFYIGVGTQGPADGTHGGRWTQHVTDALFGGGNAPRHQRIREWFRNNPCPKGKEKEHAVNSGLVRRLYAVSGNGAKELKFFTEQFLIAHAFGAHNLENSTSGNWKTVPFAGISRPFVFDASKTQHVWSWAQLLIAFVHNPNAPTIKNALEPALLTLVAATLVPGLDQALARLGLLPLTTVPEGRLANEASFFPHLNVSGAGDCMISYWHPGRFYRFDLRFAKTGPHLRINMRPSNRQSYGAFVQAIDGTHFAPIQLQGFSVRGGGLLQHYGGVSPVKNVDQWPYYQPMADHNGGKDTDWFDVSSPAGRGLSFNPTHTVRPCWLDPVGPPASLTLVGALELILKAFR